MERKSGTSKSMKPTRMTIEEGQQHEIIRVGGEKENEEDDDHDVTQQQWIESSSPSIANKKKWKCAQCTYENWPSSIKCTICLASKSSCATSSSSSRSTLNNNNITNNSVMAKKKIAAASAAASVNNLSSNSNSSSRETLTPPPQTTQPPTRIVELVTQDDKWSCPQCTYFNWPKSVKCVQCYTPKMAVVVVDASANTNNTNDLVNVVNTSNG